jgi:hypothetical protein
MVSKTHSELLFEQYLSRLAVSFEHEPNLVGRSKRPDYLIDGGDARVWLEVKEFDAPKTRPDRGFMFGEYFQRTPLLLDSIEDVPSRFRFSGTAKLTKDSNTTISAIIILQHYSINELWVSVMNRLLDRQANGAKLPPGASLQLLADLRSDPVEITHPDTVRCVVLENPHARFALPTHLFAGAFDQRWGQDGDEYTMLWTGTELVKLRNRSKPVPFVYP